MAEEEPESSSTPTKKRRRASTKTEGAKRKFWTFPKNTLEDAIRIPKAVEDILLTPDDIGALAAKPRDLQPRARQNVVFEHGLFVSHLGPKRVCAVLRKGVELPSSSIWSRA